MSRVIRIPVEIYTRLEKHAQGFDTPANVIEKLLDYYEGGQQESLEERLQAPRKGARSRDTTKYRFSGSAGAVGKGKLVLDVIDAYVLLHPETTYEQLEAVFPPELQGSMGVFTTEDEASSIYERTGHKRHYIHPDDLIQLKDEVIAVSNQWGIGNINAFIEAAARAGFDRIEEV